MMYCQSSLLCHAVGLQRRELTELIFAGAKRLVPDAWRKWPLFDNIFRLKGVPVITVQLRYDGWITELEDQSKMQDLSHVSLTPASLHAK